SCGLSTPARPRRSRRWSRSGRRPPPSSSSWCRRSPVGATDLRLESCRHRRRCHPWPAATSRPGGLVVRTTPNTRRRGSTLAGQACTHGSRGSAGLGVAVIQRVPIDQTEDVISFVVRSHHQLAAGRERAPQRLLDVAGGIGALEAAGEGVALLL